MEYESRSDALTSKTTDGVGTGIFASSMMSLQPNTKYDVRAYATNDAWTGYGNEISFVTIVNVNLPLDGKWLSSSGSGIETSGTVGKFYAFSSAWQTTVDQGVVKMGDPNSKISARSRPTNGIFWKWGSSERQT